MNRKLFVLAAVVLLATVRVGAQAQWRGRQYQEYIDRYSGMAVKHMKVYKIPASITLAQGLLESGAGRSELARKHNNHFGIKCGGDWRGRTARYDDDARDECFRAYRNPAESYEDHSLFLSGKARYAPLFKLKITDYQGWAHGLKKAGYATAPRYDAQLIGIIERFELYRYDREGDRVKNPHLVYLSNDLAYVVAREGDTLEGIGKEFDISEKKLRKYNELPRKHTLAWGDMVYLHKKKNKAQEGLAAHVVKEGESMYSISQMYGIRLKSLYKMNDKKADYAPQVGTRLEVR